MPPDGLSRFVLGPSTPTHLLLIAPFLWSNREAGRAVDWVDRCSSSRHDTRRADASPRKAVFPTTSSGRKTTAAFELVEPADQFRVSLNMEDVPRDVPPR